MLQARHNTEYCALYASRKRDFNKHSNLIVLAFSTSGIFGWTFWDGYAQVACILIAAFQLFKLCMPQMLFSDKEFKLLDEVQCFWNDLHLKFDQLWYQLDNDIITEKEAFNQYYELKAQETEILKKQNELNIKEIKSLRKKASETSEYFVQYHLSS